jgi:large subunit ribosomal protein L1
MQKGKKYTEAVGKIEAGKIYSPEEAVKLLKSLPAKNFDETVEIGMKLGVDPRQADQAIRSTVILPNGTGKSAKVVVIAKGPKADEATAAGADEVGDDELVAKIEGGWTDFDSLVATPDMMGKVGKLGRVLGPRGLMPNPKTGTVTMDVTKAVSDIKGGKIEFRVDRQANLHFVIGKLSFDEAKLVENYTAVYDEIQKVKPSTIKGKYIIKASLSSTMSPGIKLAI